MKTISEKHFLVNVACAFLLLSGCEKDTVPTITTTSITNVSGTAATSGGNITDEGSSTVTSRGVCWSTSTEPRISDNITTDGAGAGSFTSILTNLNGATNYFVRAYATNSVGTGYGMAMSFTTLGQSPTPTGAPATNITAFSAKLNGIVNANYLSTIVTFEYGATTSYGNVITATQSPVTGNTNININADLSGLTPHTVYHYRIKAVNSLGTTYSSDNTFTTLGNIPTVTTIAADEITLETARIKGSVNANSLSTDISFEYGKTLNYGSTISAVSTPVSGDMSIITVAFLTGLAENTIYHFRIKAVNMLGTSYGNDMEFTTAPRTVSDYDGNIYNVVIIFNQIWMAENLKTTTFNDGTSIPLITTNATWGSTTTPAYCWFNNDLTTYKPDYGALYNWFVVDNASNGHKNVCPTNWHIPSDSEWAVLVANIGGPLGGGKLKEIGTTHWNSPNTGATNSTGFTGRGGGRRYTTGQFMDFGIGGFWWSTTSYNNDFVLGFNLESNIASARNSLYYYRLYGISIRCLRDN